MSEVDIVQDATVNDNGELILLMSSGTEINAGNVTRPKPSVDGAYVSDGKVYIVFNDGSEFNAFDAVDLGYKDVEDVYLDGYDVYAKYLDGTEEKIGNVFFEANSEIYTTYLNRDDDYIYGVRYNGEIETIGKASDFIGDKLSEQIDSITSNENEEIILTTNTGEEYNIGKIYYNNYQKDTNLKEIKDVFVDPIDNVLKITYSDGVTKVAGSTQYVAINGMPIVLANAYINDIGHLNLEVLKVDDNGQFVMYDKPTYDDSGNLNIVEAFETNVIDAGLVKGHDGKDGTIYDYAIVEDDGFLSFITRDGYQQGAGYVPVRSVTNAYIDESGILTLSMSDETEIKTSNVLGKDGIDGENIVDATIDADKNLLLHFDNVDYPSIPAGKVDLPSEVTVDTDTEGNILFNMSNGEIINAGKLPGVHSKYITRVYNNVNGLYVKYSDESDSAPLNYIGNLNNYPQSFSITENEELELKFSDGTTLNGGTIPFGKDADTILDLYTEGRDLIVKRTTDDRKNVIEQRIEDFKGLSINDITYEPEPHVINFAMSDGTNKRIPLPQIRNGEGVADVIVENSDIIFILDDGSERRIEDVKGDGIRVKSFKHNELTLVTTDSEEEYTLSLPTPKDGNAITDVTLNGDEITFKFTDLNDFSFTLPKGTVSDKNVADVYSVFDNNDEILNLVVEFKENIDDVVIPIPKPKDGDTIKDIYINVNDDLVIEMEDEGSVVFPTIKGKDANNIVGMTYDNTENKIVFNMSDSTEHYVTLPEFNDGIDITNITHEKNEDGDYSLKITTSDNTSYNVALPIGKDGRSIHDITTDENNITFVFSDNDTKTFSLPKGKDGNGISNITYNNNVITITEDNGKTTDIPFRTGKDGKGITNISSQDRTLFIETNILEENSSEFVALEFEMFQGISGQDGKDGVNVENISVVNNDLVFEMSDNNNHVIENAGRNIEDIQLVNGRLNFLFNNGSRLLTDSVMGKDGKDGLSKGITDINILNNTLNIEVSDVTGVLDNVSVDLSAITVDRVDVVSGDLIIYFRDGTEKNLGRVEGNDFKWIKQAFISNNDILTLVLTDGTNDSLEIIGNVRGKDGVHIQDIDIERHTGDFYSIYSDGRKELIGNIKNQRTLSVWNSSEVPYEKDAVVIHNTEMYIATRNTYNTPPHNVDWKKVSTTDSFTEVLTPRLLIENNDNFLTTSPTIRGSDFIGFNTTRKTRYFEVHATSGGDLVYSRDINNDYITIPPNVLEKNKKYNIRIKDESVNGFMSGWSEPIHFVIDSEEFSPIIKTDSNLFNLPLVTDFYVDEYLVSNVNELGSINRSDWFIYDTEGNLVHENTLYNDIKLPLNGILEPNKSYTIHAIVRTSTGEYSATSNVLAFKTEETSEGYIDKPVLYTDNPIDNKIYTPDPIIKSSKFKKKGLLLSPENYFIDIDHTHTDWEIIDAVSGETALDIKNTRFNKTSIQPNYDFSINKDYSVRCRYRDENRNIDSEWSDWLTFSVFYSVHKPILTTSEDTSNFPPDGIIKISEFSAEGEINHVSTTVEIVDIDTGEDIYTLVKTSEIIDEFQLTIPPWVNEYNIAIRAKHKSNIVESEWSEPLLVTPATGKNSELAVNLFPDRQHRLIMNNADNEKTENNIYTLYNSYNPENTMPYMYILNNRYISYGYSYAYRYYDIWMPRKYTKYLLHDLKGINSKNFDVNLTHAKECYVIDDMIYTVGRYGCMTYNLIDSSSVEVRYHNRNIVNATLGKDLYIYAVHEDYVRNNNNELCLKLSVWNRDSTTNTPLRVHLIPITVINNETLNYHFIDITNIEENLYVASTENDNDNAVLNILKLNKSTTNITLNKSNRNHLSVLLPSRALYNDMNYPPRIYLFREFGGNILLGLTSRLYDSMQNIYINCKELLLFDKNLNLLRYKRYDDDEYSKEIYDALDSRENGNTIMIQGTADEIYDGYMYFCGIGQESTILFQIDINTLEVSVKKEYQKYKTYYIGGNY